MVMVSVSETYDLHTEVDKMTVIGIHTPTKELIQKTYPGLCMNSKYFRIDHVDFMLSTAQTLPLGVDQIGLDANKIHPQDMMNPILYKAVSNDSWSTLEARLMGMDVQRVGYNLKGSMALVNDQSVTGLADEHGVYYSLLANRDGFKTAHPQQGLTMKGLVPLVFDAWYSHGENVDHDTNSAMGLLEDNQGNMLLGSIPARSFRGRPHPMPRINTTYLTGAGNATEVRHTNWEENGMGPGSVGDGGAPRNYQVEMPNIDPIMLGCVVLPPVSATTGIIYYRMVCRAYIEFSEVRPIQEITSFSNMASYYAPLVYHTDYNEQSKSMDQTTDLVDIKNGSIEKIMEGR